jgi:hypothetical protein
MSERLFAPARSPLRRLSKAGANDLGIVGKIEKQRRNSKNWAKNAILGLESCFDPEADALRQSAQIEDGKHDISHLSACMQRFWQVLMKNELSSAPFSN